MSLHLDFLNKNLLRKYPFQASATLIADNGSVVPTGLIASLKVTTVYGRHKIYVKQLVLKNGTLNVTVAHHDNSGDIALGHFTAAITDDFQEIPLTSFELNVSGYLTTGLKSSFSGMNALWSMDYSGGKIEESAVFCYTPPAVTSLNCKGNKITGRATFSSFVNITKTQDSQNFRFQVTDPSSIASLADRSSQFGNCPTPVIKTINGAIPYTSGEGDSINDGNIYLIGVTPIGFTVDSGSGSLQVGTTDLTITSLCTARNKTLPPLDPAYLVDDPSISFVAKDNYFSKSQTPVSNFLQNSTPEYISWPQFLKTKQFSVNVTGLGVATLANPLGIDGTLMKVLFKISNNSAKVTLQRNGTPLTSVSLVQFNAITPTLVLPSATEGTLASSDVLSLNVAVLPSAATITVTLFYK